MGVGVGRAPPAPDADARVRTSQRQGSVVARRRRARPGRDAVECRVVVAGASPAAGDRNGLRRAGVAPRARLVDLRRAVAVRRPPYLGTDAVRAGPDRADVLPRTADT